jgi:hypothetical protein
MDSVADHRGNKIVFTIGLSTSSIKASFLIWLRLAQQKHRRIGFHHAFIVQKGYDVFVRLAPEPATLSSLCSAR